MADCRTPEEKEIDHLEAAMTLAREELRQVKACHEKFKVDLRKLADGWRGDASRVDHPMRLQSPSWPLECAGDIENLLDDAGCSSDLDEDKNARPEFHCPDCDNTFRVTCPACELPDYEPKRTPQ